MYDSDWIRAFYDEYGMKEWDRWERDRVQTVKFEIHLHYLRRFIRPDHRVLEIGAGAGRFTRELSSITKRITVADISPVQIKLNRKHARQYGFESAVDDWVECDVCNMSEAFRDEQFDAVVCYGGALSYAMDRRLDAVRELARTTRQDGHVLVSVMSLFGGFHQFLPSILTVDYSVVSRVIGSGDITADESVLSSQRHHEYRPDEFRKLLRSGGLTPLIVSASNTLSATWEDELEELHNDPIRWSELMEMEIEASKEPGCEGMGTHLIAVCQKAAATG